MAIWSQLAIVLLGLHGVTWLLEAMCFAGSMVCFVVLGFEEKCWLVDTSTQTHTHTHAWHKQTNTAVHDLGVSQQEDKSELFSYT